MEFSVLYKKCFVCTTHPRSKSKELWLYGFYLLICQVTLHDFKQHDPVFLTTACHGLRLRIEEKTAANIQGNCGKTGHIVKFFLISKNTENKNYSLNYVLLADLSFRYECHSAVNLNATKTSSMPQPCITEPSFFIQTLRNKQAIAGGHQVGLQLGALVGS